MNDSEGPDFGAGLYLSEVPEGQFVSGSFRGQRVLLANNQGRYCALSATCTHLGAPLGDGILVEGRVHCPWHHARFSLETGEAVAAPAFDPLTRFGTSVQDGRVFVTEALESIPVSVAASPAPRVVIIGGGAGGYACAQLLVRSGFGGAVTVVSDDADAPYDRTFCSKQYLIGMKSRDDSKLADPALCQEGKSSGRVHRVNCQARSLDTRTQSVLLDTGERLAFDVLVLATGAEPKRPQLPGLDRPNVHVLRTLKDADALIQAAREAKRVAIIGASFIGLEAAASLKQRNLEVHVVTPDDVPLEKLLGAKVANMIRKVHEEKGVHFHLGRQARGFDGTLLTLDDGSTVEADFVVLGVGVTPRTGLAEAAGLECASANQGGGVNVNQQLETSVPGIFAIGDIARYPDPHSGEMIRVEHWVHAERQGQHVARVLMREASRYADVPFFWSAHFDTGLRYLGHIGSIVDARTEGSIEGRNFAISYTGKDQEKAFVTCNRDRSALLVEAEWDRSGR
jgi:NADPH-dependent 2,4-dienoyl-CoA reductase/sulfur reductase-like enzyme/nitrite reductase/ring-hydroxylating ferredoxin subunit